jgi:hypothetical protein
MTSRRLVSVVSQEQFEQSVEREIAVQVQNAERKQRERATLSLRKQIASLRARLMSASLLQIYIH